MSHRIESTFTQRLAVLSPFGLGHQKPHHFLDTFKAAWANRDNLGYAWDVLSKGACDGCALGVAGLHDWTIDGMHLCTTRLNLLRLNTMPAFDHDILKDVSKLRTMSNSELRQLGRLAYPMRRRKGEPGFTRITWDEALGAIAARIKATTPDRTALYLTSRGITNETYYVAQKVARLLGTNNVDNAARLCHSPSTAAMKAAIGAAATTCSYTDWYGTDLLVFFGANPANDQPVTTKYLHGVKKTGTHVSMVNPHLEPGMKRYWVPSTPTSAVFGTKIADTWFPVTQGGDIAFLYGVIKLMLENKWYDEAFVNAHTTGFDDLKAFTESLSWEDLESKSGLDRDTMREFAELVRDAKTGVLVWSMGITQHRFGADGVAMICNLGLLKGWVGRDKCGLMPIRGHSGVQGGAEMGAYATVYPGGRAINDDTAAEMRNLYGFDVPTAPGLNATAMVEAAHRGELDVLYCVGGNFLRALPEPDYVSEAMARVPMRVHQDIVLTDQLFIDPAIDDGEVILLPAATRYEQEGGGTQTSTERRVMFSPQLPRQVGEARTEWRILRDLAKAVDPERAKLLGCDTGEAIREEIAKVIPVYDGIQNLHKSGDAFQYAGPHLCPNGRFGTADGKGHLRAVEIPEPNRGPGCFHVSTRRGKQFNTLIYAETDPLTGAPRDAVLMNADDAASLHLKQGDRVTLVSDTGKYAARVHLAPLAPGNLQVHWPEGNVILKTGIVDAGGGVPDYNAFVTIEKA
ncbi:MAG: FdhF/YdeP family oxidoreductase [Phycisphaera sp.]|nr:FdhF/YdeP family oxidoreductase [Phycisphaera sp.]